MDVAAESREDVDRRIRELRERFGEFPVREETVENDRPFFESGREMAASGWRGDAGAWVSDDAGRVLLIRHEDADGAWGVPGGSHKPGESFRETAEREVREETGVECELTGVVFARRKRVVLADESDRQWFMLTVVFEADAVDADDLSIGDDEVEEARWFGERPDQIAEFVREQADGWNWPDGS
jgi:ADP-ribose pyrophosphatase YjhB (NUDIX family)